MLTKSSRKELKELGLKAQIVITRDPLLSEIIKVTGHSDAKVMTEWTGNPIVLTCWNTTIEDYVYPLLSKLRKKYDVFFDMEIWDDVGKFLFKTKINYVPVYIQILGAKDCKMVRTSNNREPIYKLDCSGDIEPKETVS